MQLSAYNFILLSFTIVNKLIISLNFVKWYRFWFSELNECDSNPCQNSGTCRDAINGFVCSCYIGYEGDNCENGYIKYWISIYHNATFYIIINIYVY